LQEEDLWELPPHKRMAVVADQFEAGFEAESAAAQARGESPNGASPKSPPFLPALLFTPLMRALWRIYKGEMLHTGAVRALNTLIQFAPAMLVRRLLQAVEVRAPA
jgi:hypothetical protein